MTKTYNSLKVFKDIRMAKIFLLGIISGFPWVLIATGLSLWLKEEGLSRSTIGWAGLIFSVYAINFLWAPIIDNLKIPFLFQRFGRRKSWIILCQLIIFLSLLAWGQINPANNLHVIIGVGLIIAIFSATQDIAIDALRIEQVIYQEKEVMAAGAAMAVIGWWTGYKVGGVVALYLADVLQEMGFENYWEITFSVLCCILFLSCLALLTVKEATPSPDTQMGSLAPTVVNWVSETAVRPLTSFFKKNGIQISILLLLFILLFKLGEAFMGRMSVIFYSEIGFSKSDIAVYSKSVGWITTVLFTLLGSFFVIKGGIIRALFISGIAMASTNLLFSLLAWVGKDEVLFAVSVLLDDLATAFATIAFVAFISLLVDRKYTATQYALLASIGTAGRTVLASSSGSIIDNWLGGSWVWFFVITTLLVIPSLYILFLIRKKVHLN